MAKAAARRLVKEAAQDEAEEQAAQSARQGHKPGRQPDRTCLDQVDDMGGAVGAQPEQHPAWPNESKVARPGPSAC